jgi:hypothetical protein
MQRVAADLEGLAQVKEVIYDLDYHSARLQHLRCGLPLDAPVHDPAWIEEAFAAAAKPSSYAELSYPETWRSVTETRTRVWDSINDIAAEADYISNCTQAKPAAPPAVRAPRPAPAPPAAAQSVMDDLNKRSNKKRQRDKRPNLDDLLELEGE